MENWLPIGFDSQEGDFGEAKPLVPCFQKHIELSRIIELILGTTTSRRTQDHRSYQARLDGLNLELSRWHSSLPDCTKWNRWEATSAPLIPSVAALQFVRPHGNHLSLYGMVE